jgi:hypothetical protein
VVRAAAAAVLISTVLNALGVFIEDAIHWVNLLIGFAMALVAAALVFGVFVRHAVRTPRRAAWWGLGFAVLALLTVPVFWSGLPPVFGVAAIYLGRVAWRTASPRSRVAIAPVVLGAAAILADVGAYATDVASRY